MKQIIALNCFLFCLIVYTNISLAEMTVSQIAATNSKSVVTVVALDENDQPLSLGSGFFISSGGDIATNHHVLEGSAKAIIKTLDGQKGRILEIIKDDPALDLLVAKTSIQNTQPLPLGDSDTITIGEDIIAIGNPAGLEGTISKGIISGIRKTEETKFIQITAPISPGSSGGPVFNLSGQVIGVATAYLDLGQNLNFAMPINYLKSLKSVKINLASLPKSKSLEATEEDTALVQVFDVHYNIFKSNLTSIDFAIRNQTNYLIKNVKLFFVYKNSEGDVISYSATDIKEPILPKLALQFNHKHFVKYFYVGIDYKENFDYEIIQGTVEIRVLDYEIDRSVSSSPSDLLFK